MFSSALLMPPAEWMELSSKSVANSLWGPSPNFLWKPHSRQIIFLWKKQRRSSLWFSERFSFLVWTPGNCYLLLSGQPNGLWVLLIPLPKSLQTCHFLSVSPTASYQALLKWDSLQPLYYQFNALTTSKCGDRILFNTSQSLTGTSPKPPEGPTQQALCDPPPARHSSLFCDLSLPTVSVPWKTAVPWTHQAAPHMLCASPVHLPRPRLHTTSWAEPSCLSLYHPPLYHHSSLFQLHHTTSLFAITWFFVLVFLRGD